MFAVPFSRILWKEYRVQRALWLSCLLIGVLFQAILRASIFDPQMRATLLICGSSFFPVMYAIGCGALLFAGERDDGTSEWLNSLPLLPVPTLSAKFAFAAGSTIVLQLLLTLISLGFLAGTSLDEPFVFLIPFGLTTLVWSILGSLVSRRVLASVPAMAFWCIVPNFVVLAAAGMVHGNDINWDSKIWSYFTLLTFVALGVDTWLGWNWCYGHYFDGSIVEKLRTSGGAIWNRFTRRVEVLSRIPARVENEQPWRRAWQRLVWQERHRESAFRTSIVVASALVGMLAFATATTSAIDSGVSTTVLLCGVLSLCLLAPLVLGVLSFKTDAQQQQSRFLASRGVSPAAVWLARQAVWLPRAIAISVIAFLVPFIAESSLISAGPSYPAPRSLRMHDVFSFACSHPQATVAILIFGYASGQLAAILFQRTILAMVFGVILNIVLLCWVVIVWFTIVPGWWFLGFPVVAMLLITLWQTKPVLLEDHSHSRRLKLFFVLTALPAVMVMMFACHRIIEVAMPLRLERRLVELFHAFESSKPWQLTSEQEFVRRRLETLSQISEGRSREAAEEVIELMKRELPPAGRQAGGESVMDPEKLSQLLDNVADEFIAAGEPGKALDCYLANLRLARMTSNHGGFLEWRTGSMMQQFTLDQFGIWANLPGQTPLTIREASSAIEAELSRFPTAALAIVNSYVHDREIWVLASRAEVLEELCKRYSAFDWHELPWPLIVPSMLPWERVRLDFWLTRKAELTFSMICSLESRLSSPTLTTNLAAGNEFTDVDDVITRQASTTFLAVFSNLPSHWEKQLVIERQVKIRATLTRLESIASRLEHEELPD